MKKEIIFLAITLLTSLSNLQTGLAKGIPFSYKNAFILEYDEAKGIMKLDVPKANEHCTVIHVNENTVFTDKKGKDKIEKDLFRPGMEVNIEGEETRGGRTASSIAMQIDIEDWTVKVEGILEKIEGETAWVDGQAVKLKSGAKIKGKGEWKKYSADDEVFEDILLGAFVNLKGWRTPEGDLWIKEGTVEPNRETANDKKLKEMVELSLNMDNIKPPISVEDMLKEIKGDLYKGTVQIGGLEFKLVEDYQLQAYVNRVGFRVIPSYLQEMDPDDEAFVDFRFYVIDNPTFNAFAFPNGEIFVHTGLLSVLENEAQLATILGHEIAHVTHEHGRERYENNKIFNTGIKVGEKMAAAFTKSKDTEDIIGMGLDVSGGVLSNAFGREHENQADRVGLYYMYNAGYDPQEAPKVWKKLMDLTGDSNYMRQVKSTAEQLLLSEDIQLEGKSLTQAGSSLLGQVADSLFSTLYSSHPEAKKRFRSLNRILAFHYRSLNTEANDRNEEDYQKKVANLEK